MECKNCKALLEEGVTVCPACGANQTEEMKEETVAAEETAAPVEEAPTAEIKKGITMTPGKLTLVIGGAVVLTALIVALILQGTGILKPLTDNVPATDPIGDVQETQPVGTVPADGNADDATCKGSYTVSDDAVIAAMDTVVATVGDAKLTNGELQVYYWMQVRSFLGSYGAYASALGLDYTQPLDVQQCGLTEEPMTWQQFFLANALDSWHNYQALANESLAGGFEIPEDIRAYLDAIPETLLTEGGLQGFESAEDYVAHNLGKGCTLEDYISYMELYYQGYTYFENEYEKLVPTDDEVLAYFQENAAMYEEQGVTEDTVYVDARHILVFPQGGTTDESGAVTYSDEEWDACRQEAQDILDQYLAGDATEDSFAALANEKSQDPGSNTNGGLYEDIYEGQMVEPFENWCFDESRVYGDTGLVQTNYGYHVMFYVGSTPAWQAYAQEDLLSERANAMVLNVMERHPLEVDYEAIALGYIDLAA